MPGGQRGHGGAWEICEWVCVCFDPEECGVYAAPVIFTSASPRG